MAVQGDIHQRVLVAPGVCFAGGYLHGGNGVSAYGDTRRLGKMIAFAETAQTLRLEIQLRFHFDGQQAVICLDQEIHLGLGAASSPTSTKNSLNAPSL